MKSSTGPLVLVTDTREQRPYGFANFPGVEVVRATLRTGDYSVRGLEDRVALERKSLDDLVACLKGKERARFERELERAARLSFFRVIVEAPFSDLARGRYYSKLKPASAEALVTAMEVRYGAAFLWAENRAVAEYHAYRLLNRISRNRDKHMA